MANIDTWIMIQRMEAELRHRAVARRARLGPLPQQNGGRFGLNTALARLALRLLRRNAVPAPVAGDLNIQPVCHGRTLASRRVCRICGARAHGAAAFRPGYRPHRCSRRSARGKTRI